MAIWHNDGSNTNDFLTVNVTPDCTFSSDGTRLICQFDNNRVEGWMDGHGIFITKDFPGIDGPFELVINLDLDCSLSPSEFYQSIGFLIYLSSNYEVNERYTCVEFANATRYEPPRIVITDYNAFIGEVGTRTEIYFSEWDKTFNGTVKIVRDKNFNWYFYFNDVLTASKENIGNYEINSLQLDYAAAPAYDDEIMEIVNPLYINDIYLEYSDGNIPVTGISLNKNQIYLKPGDSEQLIATIYPVDATNKNVIWSVDNPDIINLNNGFITALHPGIATVVATSEDGGFYDICQVVVLTPVTGIILNKDLIYLKPGETENLIATIYPADATNKNVIWSVDNPDIINLNNGFITALHPGLATVVATSEDGGFYDICQVVVLTPVYETNLSQGIISGRSKAVINIRRL